MTSQAQHHAHSMYNLCCCHVQSALQETLDEFLALAGTKYKVPVFEKQRAATSAEYYSGLFVRLCLT